MGVEPGSPIDFRAEVLEYDRTAEFGVWDGPRHRVPYRALGEGPALLLVPGLASTYRGHAPTLIRLARRFRTIQILYPGDSPDDGAILGRIAHEDLVDDVLGLVQGLGLGPTYLFGLSFGSTLALRALHRAPKLFPKAAIQGGFARRRLLPHERLALAFGRRLAGPTARLPMHKRALAVQNRTTFPPEIPDLWAHYVEENGLTPIASLAHRLDLLDRLDLRPILPEIRQKVLLIWGTADRIVPRACLDELAAGLPDREVALMPGVGHQPHWTHPERLATLVGEFFEGG